MAKFELPIYGENDEVIKEYATNVCPWGVFVRAAEASQTLKKKDMTEQFNIIGGFLQTIFIGLTKEELERADYEDVMNTFNQIVSIGDNIKAGNGKNV